MLYLPAGALTANDELSLCLRASRMVYLAEDQQLSNKLSVATAWPCSSQQCAPRELLITEATYSMFIAFGPDSEERVAWGMPMLLDQDFG